MKARESKQLNSKDFIEIYHNSALKSGSLSYVSSKHSKLGPTPHFRKEEMNQANGDSKNKKKFLSLDQRTKNSPCFDEYDESYVLF